MRIGSSAAMIRTAPIGLAILSFGCSDVFLGSHRADAAMDQSVDAVSEMDASSEEASVLDTAADFGAMCAAGPGEFCAPPNGDCDGEPQPTPTFCIVLLDPIPECGCDGISYPDDCDRIRARVARDHYGPC